MSDLELVKKELAPFLSPDAQEHAKSIAVENVLGFTGTDEGIKLIGDSENLLQGLVSLTDDRRDDIQEGAYKCLINLSTDETAAIKILKLEKYEKKCVDWLKKVLNSEFKLADIVCQLLSNLTRIEEGAQYVAEKVLGSNEISIDKIVLVLCNLAYNQKADLHYLASLLSNLSQAKKVRKQIMDKDQCIIQRLLPFTEFHQSAVRRHGVVGTLKNCCFDTEYHDWLLSDDVDLLPRLLLPLAGPEEFDDDDNEGLPEDLQYLPPDKEREPNPRIRKMLVEALLQLCATRKGRKFLKAKNTYIIMREYYAWERKEEPANETAALNLIDVLIADEPSEEMGDNLKDLEIPDDIQEKFHKDDELEQQQKQ